MINKTILNRYINKQFNTKYDRNQSLETWLVRHLCHYSGADIENHLKDIATYGCQSGCVSDLIYNADIIHFYTKYESQIWEQVHDYIESTGQTIGQFMDSYKSGIEDEIDLKVHLTWFAIEYLAYRFLSQFNVCY
jgi:hypothetical protein